MTQLTELQLHTLDWGLTCLLEQTAERGAVIQPDQTIEEVNGLASLVELIPEGDLRGRLTGICNLIRAEHQPRLDALLAEEAKPTYDELLQMLDDVSASASNLVHFAPEPARVQKIEAARELCDRLLRPDDQEEE